MAPLRSENREVVLCGLTTDRLTSTDVKTFGQLTVQEKKSAASVGGRAALAGSQSFELKACTPMSPPNAIPATCSGKGEFKASGAVSFDARRPLLLVEDEGDCEGECTVQEGTATRKQKVKCHLKITDSAQRDKTVPPTAVQPIGILVASLGNVVLPPSAATSSSVGNITIEKLLILRGSGSALNWDDVIGLNVPTIVLRAEVSGPAERLPNEIPVRLIFREPNKGPEPIPSDARPVKLPRSPQAPSTDRVIYECAIDVAELGRWLNERQRARAGGQLLSIATIARPDNAHDGAATSDARFREALPHEKGWELRGISRQPVVLGLSSGDETKEIPDAKQLMKAGGVLVLEATVAPPPGVAWNVKTSPQRRLFRSPADIVYYTGHGLSHNYILRQYHEKGPNALGLAPAPNHSLYQRWLFASELAVAWRGASGPRVLIIAGCSVLGINLKVPQDDGLDWLPLLGSDFPLQAALGYGGSAPSDKGGAADAVARMMGAALASGSTTFVSDWMKANAESRAWNAVALDRQGYWQFDQNPWVWQQFLHTRKVIGPIKVGQEPR